MDNTIFNLNDHTLRLLLNEPFFAALSRRINKYARSDIPTAGVRFNEDTLQFELFYNPNFMQTLNDTYILGVLKHEFYHLIFEHVTKRIPTKDKKISNKWNIATDLAINSFLINELPNNCCCPGKNFFKDYPLGKSAEWYYNELQNDEICNFISNNSKQFDDHSEWSSNKELSEVAKEKIKNILKKAIKESQQMCNGWGTLSQECKEHVLKLIQTKINWRAILRYFVKTSQRANKNNTPRKINKRYQLIHPGKKIKRQANIAIAIDQSGSISDELLQIFFAELMNLSKIASFTVIPHDADIDESEIFIWKKDQKINLKRICCGGTDFNPPTLYINKHKFDGAIFLTDLQAPKPKSCKCQRLWITTEKYKEKPYFITNERIVAINK